MYPQKKPNAWFPMFWSRYNNCHFVTWQWAVSLSNFYLPSHFYLYFSRIVRVMRFSKTRQLLFSFWVWNWTFSFLMKKNWGEVDSMLKTFTARLFCSVETGNNQHSYHLLGNNPFVCVNFIHWVHSIIIV